MNPNINIHIWMAFIAIVLLLIIVAWIYFELQDLKLLKLVTNRNRGTNSERDLVLKLLKMGIPASCIFHDLYLEFKNEYYSQIDLIVATNKVILVFEVKDYSGWIFGHGNQDKWTQMLAFGTKKYTFYNPIRQNQNHIAALNKKRIQLRNIPVCSIIVFYGDSELKNITSVPRDVLVIKPDEIEKVVGEILMKNGFVEILDEIDTITLLRNAVKTGENKIIQEKHINNIQESLNKK